MRFFSARLNLDKGILLNFKFFLVNLFQYKTSVQPCHLRKRPVCQSRRLKIESRLLNFLSQASVFQSQASDFQSAASDFQSAALDFQSAALEVQSAALADGPFPQVARLYG